MDTQNTALGGIRRVILLNKRKRLYFFILISLVAVWFVLMSNAEQIDEPATATLPNKVMQMPLEPETQTFQATAYCYGSVTATGTTPTAGRTVAVDRRVIPMGSKLIIDGVDGYIAEDTGEHESDAKDADGYYLNMRGKRIDIYMDSYAECMEFGRRTVEVEIKEE